jgi:DNA repair exonuclease SbcCD ATPase subunit
MRLRTMTLVAIFSGTLVAQTGSTLPKIGSEANDAASLLRAIRADAEQIQSSADNLERLTKIRDTNWQNYDQQWNAIKPAQERIDLAMQRLERMQASLPPAERQALDQTKRDAEAIANATHDLWIRLGQSKVDLKAPAFNADARGLDKAARDLIKTTTSAT